MVQRINGKSIEHILEITEQKEKQVEDIFCGNKKRRLDEIADKKLVSRYERNA